jgi:serine beta-lactamase-like protein LACTB, mitochondrial
MWRSFCMLLVVAGPLLAQLPQPRPVPVDLIVDQAAREQVEKQQLVGLAVGVIENGEVTYVQGYGFADWEAKKPVDPLGTQFRWASCSKPVTAIAALQLVEAGKLDFTKNVREYVPEFPNKQEVINSKHLLTHQSGIVHYRNGKVVRTVAEYASEHPYDDVVAALDTFKESPLVNAPGEKFSYSTHGYILLSAVVQRAGGERFEDQVLNRIAKPMGMKTFQPDRAWKEIPNRAAGYVRMGPAILRRADEQAPDVSWKLGGGGYTSTVLDFARFGAGVVSGKLVSPKTAELMWTNHNEGKLPKTFRGGYGLGFHLGQTPGGQKFIGHGGSQEKSRTYLMLHPESQRGVVVMTNSEGANPEAIAATISDTLHQALSGKSPMPPNE